MQTHLPGIPVGRRGKTVDVLDTLRVLLKLYPTHTHPKIGNEPEFMAHALQEWCTGSGSGTEHIQPGSPWENPFVETFNNRLRNEFMNIELFSAVQEASLLAEQHQIEYNTLRPHSALQQWRAALLATISQKK
jgi:transposase InsO family protein